MISTIATAVVVGGGPGGLMAAEVLATAGLRVTVFEHMPSVGRKLLLAGRSGLNLTHSEPLDRLLDRYGASRSRLETAVNAFGPDALRAWSTGLGEPTFAGPSGLVFPRSLRATPLLRAWLARLSALGVTIETRTRWSGWADGGGVMVRHADGTHREVAADVVVLALGGASWPRVGSDGGWVATMRAAGVIVHDLRPANCGVIVGWSPSFAEGRAGSPLKNISLHVAETRCSPVRGDVMITRAGMEGGPVYALSATIRDQLDHGRRVTLMFDLHPDLDHAEVTARLRRRRVKDSTSTTLRRTLGLTPTAIAWLREVTTAPLPSDASQLAGLLKGVAMHIDGTASIERAISSAGGVALEEIDDSFMLRRRPGSFVVGEMLDWEAPTGGYLLQATFSTAVAAAHGALAWIAANPHS